MLTVDDFSVIEKEKFLSGIGYTIVDWKVVDAEIRYFVDEVTLQDTSFVKIAFIGDIPLNKETNNKVIVQHTCGLDMVFEKEMKIRLKNLFLNL